MAVMDEFQEERAALKDQGAKAKLAYFWDYYKWHVIISVIVIGCIISFASQLLRSKDYVMTAVMLNASQVAEDETVLENDFMEYAGIDSGKEAVLFDTSIQTQSSSDLLGDVTYTSNEKLMVYIAANQVDAMITDTASYQKYAYGSYMIDLTELLTDEELSAYEGDIYYADRAEVQRIEKASDDLDDTYEPTYPEDPYDPSTMEDPVPVGIRLDDNAILTENFYFRGDGIVFGFVAGGQYTENAVKLLTYLTAE